MGRPPIGIRKMEPKERQRAYDARQREKRRRQEEEHRETYNALQEVQREVSTLEYRIQLQDEEEIHKQLRAENDRLKTKNYKLNADNRKLRDEVHNLKICEIELRREILMLKEGKYTKLKETERSTLVKLLGVLGSNFGDRDVAAIKIGELRKRIDKAWDDIL